MRKGGFCIFHIAPARVLNPLGPADILGRRQPRALVQQPRNPRLRLIAQLVAIRPKELDPVVRGGIMTGRDHHTDIGAQAMGEIANRGRRHRPQQKHVHARGCEPGSQRIFDHIAREPRILANHHAMLLLVAAEIPPRRSPEAQRHIRRHRPAVGLPPDPVRPKQLCTHRLSPYPPNATGLPVFPYRTPQRVDTPDSTANTVKPRGFASKGM